MYFRNDWSTPNTSMRTPMALVQIIVNAKKRKLQVTAAPTMTKTSLFVHGRYGENEERVENNVRWTPLATKEKIVLPCQLVFGIYLLLLLPSGIAMGNNACGAKAMGTLPYEYITFFGLLILPRSYRYGKFAKPIKKSKMTTRKATSITEVISFIATLVGSHWIAAYTFVFHKKIMFAPRFLFCTRSLSTVTVAFSGWYLDKSYDRVTRPHELIQSGPYAVVRHPIYTSYLILFASTLITLKAFGSVIALVCVASIFYKHRMDSEEQILLDTFGTDFDQYRKKVPWRLIPFLY